MKGRYFTIIVFGLVLIFLFGCGHRQDLIIAGLNSPVLFAGDFVTAYRDPAVLYDKGTKERFAILLNGDNGKMVKFENAIKKIKGKLQKPKKLNKPK